MFQPAARNGNGVDRAGRKLQILTALWEKRFNNRLPDGSKGNDWLTSYEIAKMIGIKPSQHLRNILSELCFDGSLLFQQKPHRPNQVKIIYCVSDKARWMTPYKEWFDTYFEDIRANAGMQQLSLPEVE